MTDHDLRHIPENVGGVTRKLPLDTEAELAVLGSIVLDRDAIIEVADFLRTEDFYEEKHRMIYAAMLSLYERRTPPDAVLVMSELEKRGQLFDVGGMHYIMGLVNHVPTAVHIVYYAKRVEETALQRRCISVGGTISGIGYEGRETGETLMGDCMRELMSISGRAAGGAGYSSMSDAADEYLNEMDADFMPGIATGFTDLDAKLGGLQKSDLVIIAARPGFGKTSIVLQIALNAARNGLRVGVFELEMPRRQLMHRMIANDTGLDAQAVRLNRLSDDERDTASISAGKLAALPILIDDRVPLDPMKLRTISNRMKAHGGLDLLIVDYLQLMKSSEGARKGQTREQDVSEVSRSLKQIGKELDIPVVACAQMNRGIEGRNGSPMLSDLRESGSIEQDADVVLFLYNEAGTPLRHEGVIDIHIAKQRNGPTGIVPLYYDPSCMRFKDCWGNKYDNKAA